MPARLAALAVWMMLLSLAAACNTAPTAIPANETATNTAPGETTVPALTATANYATAKIAAATSAPSPSPVPSDTPSPSPSPTNPETPSPTLEPSPTPVPTYAILRGQVLERSNCRYGPGAPYLYKYGLVVGSNLEVIGRNDAGTWIVVRAIGGNNPCWVKASLMDVIGDVMSLEPTYLPLPQSPYYAPPRRVWATREGNEVTVSWSAVTLRAGDDTASPPYLIEAWVCRGGELAFIPEGYYETTAKIVDEAGCAEPSQARLYIVEKHGYSLWIKIGWPPPR